MIESQLANYAMYRVRRLSATNPYQSKFIRQCLKHPYKLMAWGYVSFLGFKGNKIINAFMNGRKYIQNLEETIPEIINKKDDEI